MTAPRILTFNFHEPYLCLMARTGLPFVIGNYSEPPLARTWQQRYRPIPGTFTFLDEEIWRRELSQGRFDVVIAQNETNAANICQEVVNTRTPLILVCHNRRTFLETTIEHASGNQHEMFQRLLDTLREFAEFVFISESKRDDYGLPGRVIRPGIDVDDYGGYTGEIPAVLRVGNCMRMRNRMFDVDFQERLCVGLANRVVGDNPEIPASQPAESFDELCQLYRSHRCFLHVTREEYEDGYNLAMLEAMAIGMPIVSLANPTSPLTDGKDGFLSYDADVLRGHIERLLEDHAFAREIGARARETVASAFPIEPFAEKWREAIESAAARSPRQQAESPPQRATPPPASTGKDSEETQSKHPGGAFRRHCNGYFCSPRTELAAHVPKDAKRILDVGCGMGAFGRSLKKRGAETVIGIEIEERPCAVAREMLDDALCGNIEDMALPFDPEYFDCITFGDVLEHLIDPAGALRRVAAFLQPDGVVVTSIPNVRFCQVLEMLADGRWKYDDAGILDRTHLRFFTAVEIPLMFEQAGYQLAKLQPLTMLDPSQLPRNADGGFTLGKVTVGPLTDAEYQDFLVYQYVATACKAPDTPLVRAQAALSEHRYEQAYNIASSAAVANTVEQNFIMGQALARMGKLDTAEAILREALEGAPERNDIAGQLGAVLVVMSRAAEGVPLLERAIAATPDDYRALGALGMALLASGDREGAFEHMQASLELSFDNPDLFQCFVELGESLGRIEEIEPLLRRFVEFYPGNTAMAMRLARALIRLEKKEEARDRLETVLLFDSSNEEARRLLEELS